MKITQRFPLMFNGVASFEFDDTRFVHTWTSWKFSARYEYLLSDINPIPFTVHQGDNSFSNLGYFFFFCVVPTYFLKGLVGAQVELIMGVSLLALAVICTLLYFFWKCEYVVFRNKTGSTLFGIKQTGKPEAAQFTEALRAKLAK